MFKIVSVAGLGRRGVASGRFALAVFDVDGTIVDVESSWRYLHERLGTWSVGRVYAQRFHRGEITYEEWAELDASLWRGIPVERLRRLIQEIRYVRGARETIRALREAGVKVALLSAGLTLITERIQREIGVDYAVANELLVEDGVLTGEVRVRVAYGGKTDVLREILRHFKVDAKQCVVVGDDETLIPTFKLAGLAIAFNPRTAEVAKNAHITIKEKDLSRVLSHILG